MFWFQRVRYFLNVNLLYYTIPIKVIVIQIIFEKIFLIWTNILWENNNVRYFNGMFIRNPHCGKLKYQY